MNRTCMLIVGLMVALTSSLVSASPKDVYKKAGPAVVLILGSDDGRSGSGGTGSIITAEGKIITNAHVVVSETTHKAFKNILVFLKPRKLTGDNKKDLVNRYKAKVISFSPAEQLDLAVLQIIDPPANLPIIAFADPDAVDIGDEMVAIGHPEQGGLWTLTTGAVSTVIANYGRIKGKHVFQTEASVNRGNSGGPLLDDKGDMVGINTMIARKGAGGIAITAVNFALKSSVAVKWLAGNGMGLAYATPAVQSAAQGTVSAEKEIVLAIAPTAAVALGTAGTTSVKPSRVPLKEVPHATITLAEAPPKQMKRAAAKIVSAGQHIGEKRAKEKLTAGKPLDLTKAKPKYHTPQKAFSFADIRKKQMKELEDMMDEMSGRSKSKKGNGMGLW